MAAIAIVEDGMEGAGGGQRRRSGESLASGLARVTQRHGHRLLFARPLFGKNAWARQGKDTCGV